MRYLGAVGQEDEAATINFMINFDRLFQTFETVKSQETHFMVQPMVFSQF
jgi:hypothetical protein